MVGGAGLTSLRHRGSPVCRGSPPVAPARTRPGQIDGCTTTQSRRSESNRPSLDYESSAPPREPRRRGVLGGSRTRTPLRAPPPQDGASACFRHEDIVELGEEDSNLQLPDPESGASALFRHLRSWGRPGRQPRPAGHAPVAVAQVGELGRIRRTMPAWTGVRSALRWLQA